MVGVKGTVIEEGLMLLHAGIKWDVIILDPTTQRVKEEDGVLVTELKELLTGVLE